MKLERKDFGIWKNDIFILPTFRVYINNLLYGYKNFSIEFHWLIFHARLLFTLEESEGKKSLRQKVRNKYDKRRNYSR